MRCGTYAIVGEGHAQRLQQRNLHVLLEVAEQHLGRLKKEQRSARCSGTINRYVYDRGETNRKSYGFSKVRSDKHTHSYSGQRRPTSSSLPASSYCLFFTMKVS